MSGHNGPEPMEPAQMDPYDLPWIKALDVAYFDFEEMAAADVSMGEDKDRVSRPAPVTMEDNVTFLHIHAAFDVPGGQHPQNNAPREHGIEIRAADGRTVWSAKTFVTPVGGFARTYHSAEKILRGNFSKMSFTIEPVGWAHQTTIHVSFSRALPDLDPDAAVERRDPKYFDWNVPVHRRMAFGILESQEPSRVRFDQPLPSEFVAVTASLKAASEAAWLSSADSSRTFGFVIKWPDGRTEPPAVLRYSGSLTPKADTQVANTTLIYRTPQGADSMQFEQRGYGHYNLDLYVAAATPAVRASANSTA